MDAVLSAAGVGGSVGGVLQHAWACCTELRRRMKIVKANHAECADLDQRVQDVMVSLSVLPDQQSDTWHSTAERLSECIQRALRLVNASAQPAQYWQHGEQLLWSDSLASQLRDINGDLDRCLDSLSSAVTFSLPARFAQLERRMEERPHMQMQHTVTHTVSPMLLAEALLLKQQMAHQQATQMQELIWAHEADLARSLRDRQACLEKIALLKQKEQRHAQATMRHFASAFTEPLKSSFSEFRLPIAVVLVELFAIMLMLPRLEAAMPSGPWTSSLAWIFAAALLHFNHLVLLPVLILGNTARSFFLSCSSVCWLVIIVLLKPTAWFLWPLFLLHLLTDSCNPGLEALSTSVVYVLFLWLISVLVAYVSSSHPWSTFAVDALTVTGKYLLLIRAAENARVICGTLAQVRVVRVTSPILLAFLYLCGSYLLHMDGCSPRAVVGFLLVGFVSCVSMRHLHSVLRLSTTDFNNILDKASHRHDGQFRPHAPYGQGDVPDPVRWVEGVTACVGAVALMYW